MTTSFVAAETPWHFPEEEAPPPGEGIRVVRVATHPWFLILWEPLDIEAPPSARPHCCYVSEVIFYVRPWEVVEGTHAYREYGRAKSAWWFGDTIDHEGETFHYEGGQVLWRAGRWWMRNRARRKLLQPETTTPTATVG